MKNPLLALLMLLAVGYLIVTIALSLVTNILLLRPAVIPVTILSNATTVVYYWLVYQIFKIIYTLFSADENKIKKRTGVSTFLMGTAFLIYAYVSGLAKQFWFLVFNGH